ncbi:hypothetical protein Tco_1292130 [Tanacetum coccineum]
MVIQNGNSKKRISTGKDGVVRILPPVSAAEIHAVEKERKARTILLMAIPKEHLRRFHGMDDAKEILEAIRTRFGGNANSKKMQKAVLKQQFEAFTISSSERVKKEIRQIAMIVIRMKKFYKKTRKRVRIDGNKPVGFDKKSLNVSNVTTLVPIMLWELPSKGTNDGKKRDSFYQDQGAGKKEQNQNCLLTMDDGVVNWGEHTVEEEETNHALMAISSNNEVSLCSKTCIDSYNKLKTLCDDQMNQLGEQEAKILAYTLAVKKLEAQVVTFQKQQLSLNEQLTFQANEIYAKDEKLKKYRRIGMKAVKEKEQLQKIVDSWKNSSKNLWKLVDSGMTSNSKVGLGYEIQSNNEVLSYEEEMNRTVFKCTEEDFLNKPLYSRFSKTNNFKGVPHPLYGDYTPKPQEEIDDSFKGYFGNPFKHSSESESESISVSNEMSTSKSVTTNEKVVSGSKEVEPSCATHVKTPRQQMKNQGTPEVTGLAKPVWNNANWVNHAYTHIYTYPVQLNAVRPNLNTVRSNVNTGRAKVNSVRQNVSSVRSNVNTGSFNVNTVRTKQPVSTSNLNSFSPFDMKTPTLTKDYACLIAKATSDESKLWHGRFSWYSNWLLRMKLVVSFRTSLDGLKTSLITGLKSLDQIMALNLRIEVDSTNRQKTKPIDKTEHGNGKLKDCANSRPKSKNAKVMSQY